MMFILDHLAVAAPTLAEGRAHVEEILGVSLQPGGKHAHFGTHNDLLGLEDGLYLEVIAVDPAALRPEYPRWFDLDRLTGRARLANWICRVQDLERRLKDHPRAGRAITLARGDLRWKMGVPDDGVLPYSGMFPALIEWQGDIHPAQRLDATGCRLERLIVTHPEAAQLRSELSGDLDDEKIVIEAGDTGMRAEISTPGGLRVLS